MNEKLKEKFILIASIINWISGILVFLGFMIMLVRSGLSFLSTLVTPLIVSALYCIVGWGLLKRTKWSGILAVIFSGLFLLPILISGKEHPQIVVITDLIINLPILIFVLLGWGVLGKTDKSAKIRA
jgi:uncharacterized membrane protein (DUF2068 family)